MAAPFGDRVGYREPCGNVIVVGNADRAQTAGNSRFGESLRLPPPVRAGGVDMDVRQQHIRAVIAVEGSKFSHALVQRR